MSNFIEPVSVQNWTTEEIYEAATSLIAESAHIELAEFVERFLDGKFDTCDYIEIVSLLSLLPENDPYYIGAARTNAA